MEITASQYYNQRIATLTQKIGAVESQIDSDISIADKRVLNILLEQLYREKQLYEHNKLLFKMR